MAHYVRKVLKYNEVDILFDEEVYGSTLAEAFVQTAELIGLRIKHRWHFDSETRFKKSLEEMIATQQASPTKQGIVFLATHSAEAVEAIVSSRRQGIDRRIQFIGADALSSSNFVQQLKFSPQERSQPGYYSDGTYITSPFLFDIANERAQYFRHAFLKKYQEEPMTTSALYYDAAMLALDAIKRLPPLTKLKNQRQQVKNNLWQLSRLEDAVEGVTGSLYFDENGDTIKSIPIGVYKNGRAIVALYQFQAVS
ncbi:Extracellular ligand-binding receptor, partial [Candidatus Thiomargarita nelsonii]